jgi:hypothetical protein
MCPVKEWSAHSPTGPATARRQTSAPAAQSRLRRLGHPRPRRLPAATAAAYVVRLATAPELQATSGAYFRGFKPAKSSRASYDEYDAVKLWDFSEEITSRLHQPAVDAIP